MSVCVGGGLTSEARAPRASSPQPLPALRHAPSPPHPTPATSTAPAPRSLFMTTRLASAVVISLILGSVWWRLPSDAGLSKFGLLLFSALQIAFANFAEVPHCVQVRAGGRGGGGSCCCWWGVGEGGRAGIRGVILTH